MTNKWMTSAAARLKALSSRSFGARKKQKAIRGRPVECTVTAAPRNKSRRDPAFNGSGVQTDIVFESGTSKSTGGDNLGSRKKMRRSLPDWSGGAGGRILSHPAFERNTIGATEAAVPSHVNALLDGRQVAAPSESAPVPPSWLRRRGPLAALAGAAAPATAPSDSAALFVPLKGVPAMEKSAARVEARAQDELFSPEHIERIVAPREQQGKRKRSIESACGHESLGGSKASEFQLLDNGIRRFQGTGPSTIDPTAKEAADRGSSAGFEKPQNSKQPTNQPQPIRYFNNGIEVDVGGNPLRSLRNNGKGPEMNLDGIPLREENGSPRNGSLRNDTVARSLTACQTRAPDTSGGSDLVSHTLKPMHECAAKTSSFDSGRRVTKGTTLPSVQQTDVASEQNKGENNGTPVVSASSSTKVKAKRPKEKKKKTKKRKSKHRRKSKNKPFSREGTKSSCSPKSNISAEKNSSSVEAGEKSSQMKKQCIEDVETDKANENSTSSTNPVLDTFGSDTQTKNKGSSGPHADLLALLFDSDPEFGD